MPLPFGFSGGNDLYYSLNDLCVHADFPIYYNKSYSDLFYHYHYFSFHSLSCKNIQSHSNQLIKRFRDEPGQQRLKLEKLVSRCGLVKIFYESAVIKGFVLDEHKKRYLIIREKKDDEVTAEYILPNKIIQTGWLVAANPQVNSVTIQWYMDFHLQWYPWEKFSSFLFERVYHPQLQQGLDNLKKFLEK
jgi:hypothetical protein